MALRQFNGVFLEIDEATYTTSYVGTNYSEASSKDFRTRYPLSPTYTWKSGWGQKTVQDRSEFQDRYAVIDQAGYHYGYNSILPLYDKGFKDCSADSLKNEVQISQESRNL